MLQVASAAGTPAEGAQKHDAGALLWTQIVDVDMADLDVALSRLQEAQSESDRLRLLRARLLSDMKGEEARIRAENDKTRAFLAKVRAETAAASAGVDKTSAAESYHADAILMRIFKDTEPDELKVVQTSIRKDYDEYSSGYGEPTPGSLAKIFAELMPARPDPTVRFVDLGSGRGKVSSPPARLCWPLKTCLFGWSGGAGGLRTLRGTRIYWG